VWGCVGRGVGCGCIMMCVGCGKGAGRKRVEGCGVCVDGEGCGVVVGMLGGARCVCVCGGG
jgi:hypothetical protein